MKLRLRTLRGTGDLTGKRAPVQEGIRHEIAVRDALANRSWTPYGIDRFLYDPELFTVEDVTNQYREGEWKYYIQELYREAKITKEEFRKRIKDRNAVVWRLCKKGQKECFLMFDVPKKEGMVKDYNWIANQKYKDKEDNYDDEM